ncbi:trem-like transcript 4 protein isoform 1-T2 [Molossus nigricans]
MAWEATHLLTLVLLVLLASGSWEQQPESLRKLEGETLSVRCWYRPQEGWKTKAWCRKVSADTCVPLVTHSRPLTVPGRPRYFIQDVPRFSYFTVTMTELRVEDSGFYWCGTLNSLEFSASRAIHLVVSRAPTPPTTQSTWRTFAISPVIDSPPGQSHWNTKVISSVTVVLLLLLVSTVLMILYLRRARRRARAGRDRPACEDEAVHRTDPSPGQRESQLSWGSNQQVGSGDIHYASLMHLKPFSPEDSIYVNTHASPKPTADPFLPVEYASIPKNRPWHSQPAVPPEVPRT